MTRFGFARYALGLSVAIAMFSGCGGHATGGVVPITPAPNAFPYHKSFFYTGGAQDFKVPAGVRQLSVIVLGAHGGGSSETRGGRVHAIIPVTPGATLVVYVGGNGSGATGGFNGGASGGSLTYYCSGCYGFGGGGASDVRQHGDGLANRILVSGGGGGEGGTGASHGIAGIGGKGGGLAGSAGTGGYGSSFGYGTGAYGGGGGAGGTQRAGGTGGTAGQLCFRRSRSPGDAGALGIGGAGAPTDSDASGTLGGGGGGGGYYGGGGGGAGCSEYSSGYYGFGGGGGGGGGSSYAERKATDVRFWQGWKESPGNGLVVFSW
jgi:hypothetical protein